MVMIISIVSTKGGQGKSTLALCLAYSKAFSKAFRKIALVEMDKQGTLKNWYLARDAEKNNGVSFTHLVEKNKSVVVNTLTDLIKRNDLVLMDVVGEGVGGVYTQLATRMSDLCIIPMRSSVNDEASFYDGLNPAIQSSIKDYPQRAKDTYFMLPTFVHPTSNPKKVREYFEAVIPNYVNVLPCCFFDRSVFDYYNADGATLQEFVVSSKSNKRENAKAKQANADIENIAKTILKQG
jgi:cellulose biosynthesis protein BcsQ